MYEAEYCRQQSDLAEMGSSLFCLFIWTAMQIPAASVSLPNAPGYEGICVSHPNGTQSMRATIPDFRDYDGVHSLTEVPAAVVR